MAIDSRNDGSKDGLNGCQRRRGQCCVARLSNVGRIQIRQNCGTVGHRRHSQGFEMRLMLAIHS
jgi:hypothetical protein